LASIFRTVFTAAGAAAGFRLDRPCPDRAQLALKNLAVQNPGKVDVPEERIFLGFDAYKKAIAACDVVILASPCTFRPPMVKYIAPSVGQMIASVSGSGVPDTNSSFVAI
jgi:hypothetical protein